MRDSGQESYWLEVCITTSSDAQEAVAARLTAEGAAGVVITADDAVAAYFPHASSREVDRRITPLRAFVDTLPEWGLERGPGRITWTIRPEEDWAESWKQSFHPLRIGRRIVIRPTWRPYDPRPHDLVIDLDPGMAFGTGTHATTQLCLQVLEKRVRPHHTVIDIGTGSGILAIAAAHLGARRVFATDVDEQAVSAARRNVVQNAVQDRVTVATGSTDALPGGCRGDVVVANIIADVIVQLAPVIGDLLEPHGRWIASGIIDAREEDVRAALKDGGWTVLNIHKDGEWIAMESVRSKEAPT